MRNKDLLCIQGGREERDPPNPGPEVDCLEEMRLTGLS